jgi:hypothetical protein
MARLIAVRYVVDHRPMFDRRVFCCAANGFMCRRGLTCAVLTVLAFAVHAQEQSAFQWSGFALLRQSTSETQRPLEQQRLASQFQIGLDWTPSTTLTAHLHLLARNADGTQRGVFGSPEAYLQADFHPAGDRLRIRGGAFFLPTSRENVDALWENPYAISSSALNSWLGEEFRPVGIDATYTHDGAFIGATAFRGNDTFGALPIERGWSLNDRWTLLGEHVPLDDEYVTSVSAETDGRIGWSARGGWNGTNFAVQATHIDNRSDGREHGPLYNWGTRFDILGAEYDLGAWTIAAEDGWGKTFVTNEDEVDERYFSDLYAAYALVSRSFGNARATVRADRFNDVINGGHDRALTFAYFHTLQHRMRLGAEITKFRSDRRVLLEIRYRFSGR